MRLIAAAALVAAGCSSAPDAPTWTADVKPILQANCIKCHGKVRRGGAPLDFRLDVYDGLTNERGQPVIGAAAMVRFIFERAHAETMPPVASLSDTQIETLQNWLANPDEFGLPARGEPLADNRDPEIELAQPLDQSLTGDGLLVVQYRLSDPDFDVVTGSLEAVPAGGGDPIPVPGQLYSGTGQVAFDLLAAPEDTYELVATLDDGNDVTGVAASLGEVVASHPDNAAPVVAITSPAPDTLFPLPPATGQLPEPPADCGDGVLGTGEGCDDNNNVNGDGCDEICQVEDGSDCNADPAGDVDDASCASRFCDTSAGAPGVCRDASNRVIFTVDDADGGDQLDLVVTAIRGDQSMEIAAISGIGRGKQSVVFDPGASLAGGDWTIRVGVTDGQVSRSDAVAPLVFISGPQPSQSFTEIQGILAAHCTGCHVAGGSFDVFANFTAFVLDDLDNVRRTLGGEVYRRVVLEESMPPRSTEILNGREQMPRADRDLVAEWILGGAPP